MDDPRETFGPKYVTLASGEDVGIRQAGRDELPAFTRLQAPPGDFEVAELLLGIVELDNGLRLTGRLDMDEPGTGMKVRGEVPVVRQDGYEKRYGMVYHPA
ncbi:MAG: hypothetical protein ABIJ56_10620 [Pseudomonadota bacterium]